MAQLIYSQDRFLQRNQALLAKYKKLVWMWHRYVMEQSYGGEC